MRYLRLMFFILFIRSFMLLDEEEGDWSPEEPDYTALDELTMLYARALLHLNKLGWPMGKTHRIQVDTKVIKTAWYHRSRTIPVYEEVFGLMAFPYYYVTRSGAIYNGGTDRHEFEYDSRVSSPLQLIDLGRIDTTTRHDLTMAFEYILEMQPQPVHL